jgi:hypothetical protein
VFVKQVQGRGGLIDADELMSPLEHIFGFLVRRRRLYLTMVVSDMWRGHQDSRVRRGNNSNDSNRLSLLCFRRTMLGNLLCGLTCVKRGDSKTTRSRRKPECGYGALKDS